MKNSNKHSLENTVNNGKGDVSPKSAQFRCKCTYDCCCPNSQSYKKRTTKTSNKDFKDTSSPVLKKILSVPEIVYSECPCTDTNVAVKKKSSKSKTPPCKKDQGCPCILPTNALPLRHNIADLDNALKTLGHGNKRKTKNVQQKSIQISELYEDPETKKKSIIRLTKKSQVKIEIKTFCDDTQKLEKKNKRKKHSHNSSKSSKCSNEQRKLNNKKSKEKVSIKEAHHKHPKVKKDNRKKKGRRLFGCFKKPTASTGSASTYGSNQQSDISVIYQTSEGKNGETCKTGSCIGLKAYCKTEKTGEGIVNTNTVVFPENFAGNLNQMCDGNTYKEISSHLAQQGKEIDNIRWSIGECLTLLKSNKQAVYVMSDMTQRSIPNYTTYSHASNELRRKSGRNCKVSENTYDPQYKVHDWITHASLNRDHKCSKRDDKSRGHKNHHYESRHTKDRCINESGNNNRSRTPDKFDVELEQYLKLCQHEYQVYKSSNESKSPKEKSKGFKISKKSKKNNKEEGEENENLTTDGKCDHEAVDCQCGPDCAHLGVQTSNLSFDPSKSKKSDKKAKKEAKKKSKIVDNNGDSLSIASENGEGYSISVENQDSKESKATDKAAKISKIKTNSIGCFGKFIKCILCRPY